MEELKVIIVLVEGGSDELALGTILKTFFDDKKVLVEITKGDITTRKNITGKNVVSYINELVDLYIEKYGFQWGDIVAIIHITDMDGCSIPDDLIFYSDEKKTKYFLDHIETNNIENIKKRNRQKLEVLRKLAKKNNIKGVPYRIYFNSCNLEHVLYGTLSDYSEDEKMDMADDFAEEYEDNINKFIEFINCFNKTINGESVSKKYKLSWEHILEFGLNSLKRNTNMFLLFDKKSWDEII